MQISFISEVIKLARRQSVEPSLDVLQLSKPEAHQTILLITCNTGRPSKGEGQPEKRKKAISGLLNTMKPDIVLFQEFPWVGIETLKKLKGFPVKYEYSGHSQASILYDSTKVNVETIDSSLILKLLENLKKRVEISETIPMGRMSMHEIKSKICGKAHFICVSWHGPHKEKIENRVVEFKNLLKFIAAIGTEKGMSFIIAGDFNLHYNIAKEELNNHNGLIIHEFKPLARRAKNPVDYFITSSNLTLSNTAAIDWETLENGAEEIFDHDPVQSELPLHEFKA